VPYAHTCVYLLNAYMVALTRVVWLRTRGMRSPPDACLDDGSGDTVV
jgi:hypothetical protein